MDSPFHSFCDLIKVIDQNEDSIVLDRKLRYLASDINEVLEGDENMLWSALQYFNERALEEEGFAINFALLFTSCHFDGLREHLQSSDGNSIFRAHILNMLQQNYSNAEKLKTLSMDHFYNSITLLGEFYNRLHQKSHPVLIIGRSLFELLTKELKSESAKCTNDPTHVFNVQFSRLLLTQVTLNGSLAKTHHSNEIDQLFYELRKCLIEVPNLASMTKAFLLMSLDLYYSGFKSVGTNLEKFYSKFLDEHDSTENRSQHPLPDSKKFIESDEPANRSYSLRNLKKDFACLKTNGGQDDHRRINREYLNRPLKASDRLKYFQNSNSELTKEVRRTDDTQKSPRIQAIKGSSSEICLSQTNSLNNNQFECNDASANRLTLLTISTNYQDPATINTLTTKVETVASPTESHESVRQNIHPKLENFNWFEAVEREELPDFTPNLNNSSGSNKFDTLSVASYSSNPASPQERISPKPSNTNRSRRNSLNRFRSEYYRQSNEDLHQQNEKRTHRNDSKQNYHQSWRSTGGRSSPRNDSRNGYNKRGDYDRESSNNNGRHNDGGSYNRRNLTRGGSVDSKGKDFGQQRTRHDSFNRRNQENDNFEHFQSYNRKSFSRNKDNFMNNRTLPPRLQQKWQQQRADYNNDCDNPKRFNNRNTQNSTGNISKAPLSGGRTEI
ncbi:myb-like protein D isoform X2 [Sitodiplosis mosellana]|uniref:myb-like protein D isoform X2 n=1 Tax=Sitodiplosis mosellana TaxID=263140 RepID=UPI00244404C6|nr:myb-like protein D isoform X2 [Sitodiplosis mosellana]XP_055307153.1 myb-like protein D isoform X2 [Sitodiplosis mosellana]XP_055307154.1 myb-like protein D isoform X2 [Sitodiplosis mosellana]XP_055307155.1 myb-like protein D isoform X2 [Sitodiplosis mosellana]XP_055307156.1 myb-like protein D isoform X2 [Sitodiplosis mosellana]XP_055307158.1 myb-like protein D isoform X2 [Sitodiplosis mosellana]